MRTTDGAVREVIERAIELARRYAVWWQLSNKDTFAQNEAVVNDHEDYFTTTTHALFESFVVITYQLYERRNDTISIPTLIESLAPSNAELSRELAAMVDRNKPLLAKAFAIRSGVYAHRSKKQPPEAIFSAAGITARGMETIVRVTTDIVASLADATGVDTKQEIVQEIERRSVCASDDTMLLMSSLREHAL
jgi:hypothetical protein